MEVREDLTVENIVEATGCAFNVSSFYHLIYYSRQIHCAIRSQISIQILVTNDFN